MYGDNDFIVWLPLIANNFILKLIIEGDFLTEIFFFISYFFFFISIVFAIHVKLKAVCVPHVNKYTSGFHQKRSSHNSIK